MDYNDHYHRVGYIHMNLTALESSLRFLRPIAKRSQRQNQETQTFLSLT